MRIDNEIWELHSHPAKKVVAYWKNIGQKVYGENSKSYDDHKCVYCEFFARCYCSLYSAVSVVGDI